VIRDDGGSTLVIGVGDCATSADPAESIATYALGSCIAVSVYDPAAKVGGLLHFLLPDTSKDTARVRENPYLCADTGIPELLNRCIQMGARKRRLLIRAAGGASVLDDGAFFNVGHKNYLALQRTLSKLGLRIHAEAIGGQVSRSVRLDIGTGKCWVREGTQPPLELLLMPV
jgi:chemotaxis protein CheD